MYQDGNDLKSYIPGVGFVVTSLETGESHVFPEKEEFTACSFCGNEVSGIGGGDEVIDYCNKCDMVVEGNTEIKIA